MPAISVILPVYNGEKTLRATIDSVLQQTFADFELIVINDGSQDGTLEVLATIQDSRIQVFSYSNSGVSISRNRGILEAKGEYIAFIDADDLWTPDKLAAQFNALQANPQAAVAYSWTDWVDLEGNFLRSGSHICLSGQVFEHLLMKDFVESGSNPLIRREALAAIGEFDPTVSPAEDWDLWLRLAARYEFINVPEAQILYRITPGSASANVWRMEASSIRVIEKALALLPNPNPELRAAVLAERYRYLTIKTLEAPPERKRGLTALRFFWSAIRHDPTWLRRSRLMAILGMKMAIAILLPPPVGQRLLAKIHQLAA